MPTTPSPRLRREQFDESQISRTSCGPSMIEAFGARCAHVENRVDVTAARKEAIAALHLTRIGVKPTEASAADCKFLLYAWRAEDDGKFLPIRTIDVAIEHRASACAPLRRDRRLRHISALRWTCAREHRLTSCDEIPIIQARRKSSKGRQSVSREIRTGEPMGRSKEGRHGACPTLTRHTKPNIPEEPCLDTFKAPTLFSAPA